MEKQSCLSCDLSYYEERLAEAKDPDKLYYWKSSDFAEMWKMNEELINEVKRLQNVCNPLSAKRLRKPRHRQPGAWLVNPGLAEED